MFPMSSSALQGFIDADVDIYFSFLHLLRLKLRLVAYWTTWTTLITFLSSFFSSCLFWGDVHNFYLSFPLSWHFLPLWFQYWRTFVCSLNIPLVKHLAFPFVDNKHSLFVNSSVRALKVYFWSCLPTGFCSSFLLAIVQYLSYMLVIDRRSNLWLWAGGPGHVKGFLRSMGRH